MLKTPCPHQLSFNSTRRRITLCPSTGAHTTQPCYLEVQQARIQGARAGWRWRGLCGGASWCQRCCRNSEYLPCDPGRLLLWRRGCQRAKLKRCYVWMYYHSISTPKICHWIQIHIPGRSLFCWYSGMRQLYKPSRSTPPPSNSVQSESLYSAPGNE